MKALYKLLFFMTMMMGTLISISSMSWMMIWMGLEINLLSLMPLMKNMNNKMSSESTIKYFIIQAMASSMFLFSIILFTNSKNFSMQINQVSSLMINSTLVLKMGAAPMHFWLPEIISGLSWETSFVILTWQKIAPMIILIYSTLTPIYLSLIIILSSMISGMQGMNQTSLQKIMAFSSINHMSWMISAILSSTEIWLHYFIIYCVLNFNIINMFFKFNMFFFLQMKKMISFNKKTLYLFMLNFLSLGGLPPFLGFLPKWFTINFMVKNNFMWMSIFLIIFTLISLYVYMRITFSAFMMNQNESITTIDSSMMSFTQMLLSAISLFSLPLCMYMVNFF